MSDFVEVNTQDLSGAALDWAVAKAEGVSVVTDPNSPSCRQMVEDADSINGWYCYSPSTDWSQGGPLILSRGVSLHCIAPLNAWEADCWDDSVVQSRYCQSEAETPLIAACRAIVASVLGDTVSVPKELLS